MFVQVKQQGDVILKCKEVVSKYKEKTLQLAMEKQELVDKLDTKVDIPDLSIVSNQKPCVIASF